MTAYDVEGNLIAAVESFLHPANSLDQQNRSAVFLGVWSDVPVALVRIESSVEQVTILDNLVFEKIQ